MCQGSHRQPELLQAISLGIGEYLCLLVYWRYVYWLFAAEVFVFVQSCWSCGCVGAGGCWGVGVWDCGA